MKSYAEAREVVAKLIGSDLRNLCEEIGIETSGTLQEIRLRLLRHFKVKFGLQGLPSPEETPKMASKSVKTLLFDDARDVDDEDDKGRDNAGSDANSNASSAIDEHLEQRLNENVNRMSKIEQSVSALKDAVSGDIAAIKESLHRITASFNMNVAIPSSPTPVNAPAELSV